MVIKEFHGSGNVNYSTMDLCYDTLKIIQYPRNQRTHYHKDPGSNNLKVIFVVAVHCFSFKNNLNLLLKATFQSASTICSDKELQVITMVIYLHIHYGVNKYMYILYQ